MSWKSIFDLVSRALSTSVAVSLKSTLLYSTPSSVYVTHKQSWNVSASSFPSGVNVYTMDRCSPPLKGRPMVRVVNCAGGTGAGGGGEACLGQREGEREWYILHDEAKIHGWVQGAPDSRDIEHLRATVYHADEHVNVLSHGEASQALVIGKGYRRAEVRVSRNFVALVQVFVVLARIVGESCVVILSLSVRILLSVLSSHECQRSEQCNEPRAHRASWVCAGGDETRWLPWEMVASVVRLQVPCQSCGSPHGGALPAALDMPACRRSFVHGLVLTSLACQAHGAWASSLPVDNGASGAKKGTQEALDAVLALNDHLRRARAAAEREDIDGCLAALSHVPADERAFKRVFDEYAEAPSFKTRWKDQNAFIVYYSRGFDGSNRPRLGSREEEVADPQLVRQSNQFAYRNQAWLGVDDAIATLLYIQRSTQTGSDEDGGDMEEELKTLRDDLTSAVQAVDNFVGS